MNADADAFVPLDAAGATLARNTFGKLVLKQPDGTQHIGVLPVRAFPVQTPERAIAIVDPDGHEVAWVDALADVPAQARELLRAALAEREFMPEISAILDVSGFVAPCVWRVRTDRGDTSFTLKGDDDIRRLAGHTLLITDSHGIQFLIRDVAALDRESRRILDRFK